MFARLRRLAALSIALFGVSVSASAADFNFDGPPTPRTTNNISGSVNILIPTTELNPYTPRSAPNALEVYGNDVSPTTSYVYFVIYDVSIPVTQYTMLEYWIMPMLASGVYMSVDLYMSDTPTGPINTSLRDSGAVDQYGVRVHPALQGAGNHFTLQQWNQVVTKVGDVVALRGKTIRQILVAYDQPANAVFFDSEFDDIRIWEAVPSPKVLIQGIKIDQNGNPFGGTVYPLGTTSTCGPSTTNQSTSSTACGPTVNPYYAFASIYSGGYAKMHVNVPSGQDVLVSICSTDRPYECTDHPPQSYCRPTQGSSATIKVYVPGVPPAFVDMWFKFVPAAQGAGVIECDEGGFPPLIQTSAQTTGKLGDVNDDDAITVTDGVRALRCAAGLGPACALSYTDVDCNQQVTVTDGVKILRRAADIPEPFGCCIGKNCGTVVNTFGQNQSCAAPGSPGDGCTSPETCGGGGTSNVCGCTPNNAAACAGKNCGNVVNNCGQTVSCGTCTSPATCGGGGPYVCGIICPPAFSACGTTCPSDYYPVRLQCSIGCDNSDCIASWNMTSCDPICSKTSFNQCGTTCPAGFHVSQLQCFSECDYRLTGCIAGNVNGATCVKN